MALEKGQKLGPYIVESKLGSGGMGEVYKARDTRLERFVALKVLVEKATLEGVNRDRFKLEAKAISSLNHPHICALYDIGQEEGIDFLVMELLQGETLDKTIRKGSLDTHQILELAIQIAGALDAAHQKGIIHRDLKPANVFLTKDGAKLLDFGLAKLKLDHGIVEGTDGKTYTTPLTGAGAIVGTLQYMTPEQLAGKEADTRTDIFAFGSLLYELLTGRRAFTGDSQAGIIAFIMNAQPSAISGFNPDIHPALERLIEKCLKKDPEDRWQSIRDIKSTLEWIASAGSQAGIPSAVSSRRRLHLKMSWIIATVFFLLSAVLLVSEFTQKKESPPQTIKFTLTTPNYLGSIDWPRISPDGKLLAFQATDSSGDKQIWIRPMNSLEAYSLAGTKNAERHFWSPDSKYLAFFVGDQLKKIPAAGGPAQLICKATNGFDGCWGKRDIIIFDGDRNSIRQVSAFGGEPRAAVVRDSTAKEVNITWPWFLPDGEHFLYVVASDSSAYSMGEDIIKIGSVVSGESKSIGIAESRVEFSYPDYILYKKGGYLVARKLDMDKMELVGDPIFLMNNVLTAIFSDQGANFSTSENGIMVVQRGYYTNSNHLVWVDRSGKVIDSVGEAADYRDVFLSPDNKRLAYVRKDSERNMSDIWTLDLQREIPSKLVFEDANSICPIWSPDGNRIAYSFNLGDRGTSINYRNADGSGEPVHILDSDSSFIAVVQWLDNDRLLAFEVTYGMTNSDIFSLSVSNPGKKEMILSKPYFEFPWGVSPDGRYLLYSSSEVGNIYPALFVLDLQGNGGKWQIAPAEAMAAKWSADGKEIFYFSNEDLMSVTVTYENGFHAGIPKKLFSRKRVELGANSFWGYDVASDGQKFIFVDLATGNGDIKGRVEVTLNWVAQLTK